MSSHRYFVPDLSPLDRPELKNVEYRYVFVAESPHVSEVEADTQRERRPLCGSAGKVWWAALGEILGRGPVDLTAKELVDFCRKHRIAVLNAVQFPMDAKIVERLKTREVDPVRTLGFSKSPGPDHYRKCDSRTIGRSFAELRRRLLDPALLNARLIALGNDAEWFIRKSLSEEELKDRGFRKIAHPSAWWRRGGYFGKQARAVLRELF